MHAALSLQVNDEASDKVLAVEQEYNKKRRPIYMQRNAVFARIPQFWKKVCCTLQQLLCCWHHLCMADGWCLLSLLCALHALHADVQSCHQRDIIDCGNLSSRSALAATGISFADASADVQPRCWGSCSLGKLQLYEMLLLQQQLW